MDLELLVYGDTGWGDEMLRAALVTLMVSLSAMGIGLFISIFGTLSKLSNKIYVRVLADAYTTIIRGYTRIARYLFIIFWWQQCYYGFS